MSIDWQPLQLTARDGTTQEAESGEISVPESRTESSETITLKFVRIRAQQASGTPPVVFLSGGPGDSGIQWGSHGPFLRVFQQVAQHVDLILLDQRGCGASGRNLACRFPESLETNSLETEDAFRSFTNEHLRTNANRLRAEDAVLQGYTVVESAHDLEALREALGVPKITLWAYSYGTHLAQMTARLHGDRIERVVLCGFEGPDDTLKFPTNIQAQIARLSALAGGETTLLEAMRRVHDKLDSQPVSVTVELKKGVSRELRVGRFALQQLVSSWIGISNRFNRIPKLYATLDAGETGFLAECVALYAKGWTRALTFYLKDASSGATAGRLERIHAEASECLLGEAVNFPFPEIGSIIGAADIGDELRQPLRSELPFLILTGTLDGFTPTTNAKAGMRFLSNTHHILIENAAHNDLLASDEVNAAIAEFLALGDHRAGRKAVIPPPIFF